MASSATRQSVTVKDVSAEAFIKAYAAHLKQQGQLPIPKWLDLAKTGVNKEMSPIDPDWYYVRAASVARKIYLRPAGIGALTIVYGGAAKRGTRKSRFQTAAPGILRSIVKGLESIQILEANATKGGRRITSKGRKDLDLVAGTCL